MKVRIKKISEVPDPHYAHPGDAGLDLYAAEAVTITPMQVLAVPTGIQMEIPEGYVGLVWDKSGKALNNQLHCLAGVIDSGYRGEVKVVMVNLGRQSFTFEKHSKVAQILIQPVSQAKLELVDTLSITSRQEGGFGSTGNKKY